MTHRNRKRVYYLSEPFALFRVVRRLLLIKQHVYNSIQDCIARFARSPRVTRNTLSGPKQIVRVRSARKQYET